MIFQGGNLMRMTTLSTAVAVAAIIGRGAALADDSPVETRTPREVQLGITNAQAVGGFVAGFAFGAVGILAASSAMAGEMCASNGAEVGDYRREVQHSTGNILSVAVVTDIRQRGAGNCPGAEMADLVGVRVLTVEEAKQRGIPGVEGPG